MAVQLDQEPVNPDGFGFNRARENWLRHALLLAAVAVFFGHAIFIVSLALHYSTRLPVSDTWQMVPISQKFHNGILTFNDLWWPHAGVHRLVVLRVQALLLIELTSWNTRIMLLFHFVLVLATGALLLSAAYKSLRSWQATLIVASPLLMVLFTIGRNQNWLKPFTDKVPTALGAALCVWALCAGPLNGRRFAVAVVGALYASLSSFGGLVSWFAFFPVLLFLNRRWAAVWAVVSTVFIAIYTTNLSMGEGGTSVAVDPLETPRYILAFLGAPLAAGSEARAVILGLASLALIVVNYLIVWKTTRWHSRSNLAWIGLALFTFGFATTTALGRTVNHDNALTSRYQGISPLWWIAAIVIGALAVQAIRTVGWHGPPGTRNWSRKVVDLATATNVAAVVIGMALAVWSSSHGYKLGTTWMELDRQCETAMRDYESATPRCVRAYGRDWDPAEYMPYLRQRGFSIFSGEPKD